MTLREFEPTSDQRVSRGRAHVIGLAAALATGLLVNGCCAVWLVQERGLGLAALGVVLLPMSLALAWWMVLKRTSSRRVASDQTPRYALLVLAMVLGAAAVWIGSGYVRIMRQTIGKPTVAHKEPGANRRTALSISTHFRLAGAGALLQLALVTIGQGLRGVPTRKDVSPPPAEIQPSVGTDDPAP